MQDKKRLFLLLLFALLALTLSASSIRDSTVGWLQSRGISPNWIVMIISMLPVIELRGAIPVAIGLFKIPWQQAVMLSIIGNMLPIPFVLLFLEFILAVISKVPIGKKFSEWLLSRAASKGKNVQRYEALGLIIFVGIPLPGTGAWTGSVATRVFSISFWKSLIYIFLGVLLAAAIVTVFTIMGLMVLS